MGLKAQPGSIGHIAGMMARPHRRECGDLGGRMDTQQMRGTVSVLGPGDSARPRDLRAARRLGAGLARLGLTVLTGGMNGVMEAAAQGARDAGGISIGLLPVEDPARGSNAHTVLLPTGLGELRNGILVRCSPVVVAVGGSWGTLSEVAMAVRTGRRTIVVDGWRLPAPGPVYVEDADEALEQVRAFCARRPHGSGELGDTRAW